MANKRIGIMKIRQTIRLYSQGKAKFFIHKHLGIARDTVDRYVSKYLTLGITLEQVEKLSDYELFRLFESPKPPATGDELELIVEFKSLEKLLGKPGQTRHTYWLEYSKRKPDGYCYSQFCKHFRRWQKNSKPTLLIDHKAGEMLYIDYAGKRLHVTDRKTGELTSVEVFLATLGFSQMTYVEASMNQKKESLVKSVENAFLFFGGVPQVVVPDNLKSAVKKPHRYEPVINETFQDFALHYGVHVVPARVRKPQDKALVEIAVKLVYQRIYSKLRGRTFYSIEELNAAIFDLLDTYNSIRFTNRDYSRAEVFDEVEKKYLNSLPVERYEIRHYHIGSVHKNCHVLLPVDQHYYSVPHMYIREKVKIKYTSEQVWIFHKYELVALHQRDTTRYGRTTDNKHLTKAHQAYLNRGANDYLDRAKEIGQATLELIEKILERKMYLQQNFESCQGVLRLEKKVGRERLELACKRALEYESYSSTRLQGILEKGLEEADDEPSIIELPGHDNIRGDQYYK